MVKIEPYDRFLPLDSETPEGVLRSLQADTISTAGYRGNLDGSIKWLPAAEAKVLKIDKLYDVQRMSTEDVSQLEDEH